MSSLNVGWTTRTTGRLVGPLLDCAHRKLINNNNTGSTIRAFISLFACAWLGSVLLLWTEYSLFVNWDWDTRCVCVCDLHKFVWATTSHNARPGSWIALSFHSFIRNPLAMMMIKRSIVRWILDPNIIVIQILCGQGRDREIEISVEWE